MTLVRQCVVKLCGTASVEDARLAEEHGADYIGVLVEVGFSERSVSVSEARAIVASVFTPAVVLTYEDSPERTAEVVAETGAVTVQLLGSETPNHVELLTRLTGAEVWKSIYLPSADSQSQGMEPGGELVERMVGYAEAGAARLLLDTAVTTDGKTRFGGTGRTSDWSLCSRLVDESPLPMFLSGGINPGNVVEGYRRVHPFGVDLCSGVEARRGRRDAEKTRALMQALRDEGLHA